MPRPQSPSPDPPPFPSASTRMMRSPISTWSPTLAVKVAHHARVRGDERVLHLHRFDHREALARFDRLALLDGDLDQSPVHRRADRAVALFRAGLGLRERIDQRNERLPPAGESVNAAIRLMERDLFAVLAPFGHGIHIGALDRDAPAWERRRRRRRRPMRREPMSSKESATRHGSNGLKRRRPALVAPLEQKPRRGVDGFFVRRMRLGPEAPEIGVDESGVDRSGRELPAAQERCAGKRDWSSAR